MPRQTPKALGTGFGLRFGLRRQHFGSYFPIFILFSSELFCLDDNVVEVCEVIRKERGVEAYVVNE